MTASARAPRIGPVATEVHAILSVRYTLRDGQEYETILSTFCGLLSFLIDEHLKGTFDPALATCPLCNHLGRLALRHAWEQVE